jgi:hypothetical protein
MLFIPVAAVFGITATSMRLFTVSLATLSLAAYSCSLAASFGAQGWLR